MTLQLINIGAAANDGTGDNPRAAFGKANGNFREIANRLSNSGRARLSFSGDSKALEPLSALFWLLARHRLDVEIGALDSVGGSQTGSAGSGLTSPSRLAAMTANVASDIAAGYLSDMFVTSGTNNLGANGSAETALADIIKFYNAFKAAGGRYLWLATVDPRSGLGAASIAFTASYNHGISQLARSANDIFAVNTSPWLIDAGRSDSAPLGNGTNTLGSVSTDGLHNNGNGNYRKAFALEAAGFTRIYRPRDRQFPLAGQAIDANSPRGNLLGTNGRARAMGGTDSTTKGGTSSVTGTPPLGWTAAGALDGSLAITFSVVNNPGLAAMYGGTWPTVRMAFAGTPATTGAIIFTVPDVYGDTTTTSPIFGDVHVWLNSLAGMVGVLSLKNAGYVVDSPFRGLGADGSYDAGLLLPDVIPLAQDGLHTVEVASVESSPPPIGYAGVLISCRWFGGQAVSGSIDLIGAGKYRATALPAASA